MILTPIELKLDCDKRHLLNNGLISAYIIGQLKTQIKKQNIQKS